MRSFAGAMLLAWGLPSFATGEKSNLRGYASSDNNRSGNQGEVSYIFTIGSPGTANQPFPNNKRADKCFAGIRVWTMSTARLHDCSDVISQASNGALFWHARMTAVPLLDPSRHWSLEDPPQVLECTGTDENVKLSSCKFQACEAPLVQQPTSNPQLCPKTNPGHFPEPYLHVPERSYIPWTNESKSGVLSRFPDSLMHTLFANDVAYERDLAKVVSMLENPQFSGFKVVGYATAPDARFPLKQVSWLLQNATLDCVLTFKGSDVPHDFADDANTTNETFCGWPNVHGGFAKHLRDMVGNAGPKSFRAEIQRRLPQCKSLTVVGHSLGAAMVELFSYCANRGRDGLTGPSLEDWTAISWQRGTPAQMPFLTN